MASMRSVWFVLKRILGIILIVIGLAALITPLTPGAWLIIVGLELLGFGFLIPERIRRYWEEMKKSMFGKK